MRNLQNERNRSKLDRRVSNTVLHFVPSAKHRQIVRILDNRIADHKEERNSALCRKAKAMRFISVLERLHLLLGLPEFDFQERLDIHKEQRHCRIPRKLL